MNHDELVLEYYWCQGMLRDSVANQDWNCAQLWMNYRYELMMAMAVS